jgi:cytochrome bd-type quinol oxidase subunit 2
MASLAGVPADRQAAERKFYSRMALLLVAVVFIGFAPSFYLRGVVPSYPRPNPTLPPSVLLHGGLFTLWMLVFVAQTQLVAARKVELHMRLGKLSFLLALAIIPMMYLVAVWQVARANQPPFTDPLSWTIVPLAVIPSYAILVWQGWARRRQAQWHKRLMLSAAILVMLGPAIGRIPIAPPTLGGFLFQVLIGLALFIPLFVWDRRRDGHVHPATWLGFSLAAASSLLPIAIIASGGWAPIAAHLPGI